ncbi:RNA polymerase sigma factor [Maribacter sp. SA7]|uniref:RNA polymerase sigma factor n=1 Tax=Maribacter zhoushanensis TaxID=3030012 RepID=UPI0023EB3AD3|nr:RNA polymerase sigma factor [Maribacter zhoushanensis]MDF4202949.1 RNA polymerase sigma factor [Maribacter zhoushanensis]
MAEEPSVCEESVYNNIYRTHAESLRNYLYYKFGNMQRAEDIVHDSFVKLWSICSTVVYKKVASFLYSISRNLMIDTLRNKKVALKFEKGLVKELDNEDPYFKLRTKEFRLKLESVISSLPEKQREAFLMNRIDKLTYKEIAIRLDVSETAIEKRISKALIKLNTITEIKDFSI